MAQDNQFADAFKQLGKQFPLVDIDTLINLSRRNLEVAQEANEAIAEGLKAIATRQVEIAQANAEEAFKLAKEITSAKDPKESASKQADFAKTAFEKATADTKELVEIASKSNTKACELVGKQVSENIKEFSKSSSKAAKKAA